MKAPLIIGLIVYAVILAGAFAGWKMRTRLPSTHLTEETKSLVSVSTAVVATVTALVLGLLISNANTTFTRLGGEVTALSAEILRLDQILHRYGSAADPARETLRQYAEQKTADLFPDDPANVHLSNPSTYELLQQFAPHNWTSAVTLTLCALAVAGAVGMFLELEQGFGHFVRVSPQAMRQAARTLEVQQQTRISSASEADD